MSNRQFRALATRRLLAGLVLSTVLGAATASGQAPDEGPAPPEQTSPRAVLRAFLLRGDNGDYKTAAQLLYVPGDNPDAVASTGPDLAYKLYTVIRRLAVDEGPGGGGAEEWPLAAELFDAVPAQPDYEGEWSLDELTLFATEEADAAAKQITIVRDGAGRWRFSAETVSRLNDLFEATTPRQAVAGEPAADPEARPFSVWFNSLWPEWLKKKVFLLPTHQWISLIFIGFGARLLELFGRRVMTWIADRLLHRYDPDFPETTAKVWRPVGRLANAAALYYGAYAIVLPDDVISLMLKVLKLITILAAVAAAFAVIRLVSDYLMRRGKRTEHKSDDLIVPIAATTLRFVAVVIGVLTATATFIGTVPSALLGGLGIGGVAIALASQETLSNFFGSITVLFDRPFEVGDWVKIGDVEGEVESVGFRSTRVRTGMNSQVTLPNNQLATTAIDNWGRRRYRRYLTKLGVQYDTTPEQLEAFCEGIRELIRRQPHTRKDFYAAYFNDYGDSALVILLVVFFEVSDWPTELRERHRLLADILRLAETLGVQFAFPTQTLHIQRGGGAVDCPDLDDPQFAGQACAANIAGELLNYQDRPGKVKFPGPTPIEEIAARKNADA